MLSSSLRLLPVLIEIQFVVMASELLQSLSCCRLGNLILLILRSSLIMFVKILQCWTEQSVPITPTQSSTHNVELTGTYSVVSTVNSACSHTEKTSWQYRLTNPVKHDCGISPAWTLSWAKSKTDSSSPSASASESCWTARTWSQDVKTLLQCRDKPPACV